MTTSGIHLDFIVKVSKFCNLRCTYCYEWDDLGDTRFMSLENIRIFFENIKTYLKQKGNSYKQSSLGFIWHGGEPLARPASYWQSIIDLEYEIFGKQFTENSIQNSLQSNLTLL